MVAAYQSFAHRSETVGNTITVTKPSGTVDGDLLIAIAYSTGGSGNPITPPAGWTQHAATLDNGAKLLTKVASGEGASYAFTQGVLQTGHVVIVRVSGQAASSPIDAASGVQGTGNLVIPTLTSSGANRLLLQIVVKADNTTFTGPGSQTERFDAVSASQNYVSAGGDETVGSGATGSRTWTPAAGGGGGVGYMLAIAPQVTNYNGTASQAETATLSASGAAGKEAGASRTETVALSGAGNMARFSDSQLSLTVAPTGAGSTGVFGEAALGVVAGLSVVGAGAGVAEGTDIVTLTGGGATGTHSDADDGITAGLSGGGTIGKVGSASRTATVALTADSSPGANAQRAMTVALSSAGMPGANGEQPVTVALSAAGNLATQSGANLVISASPTAGGARNVDGGGSLAVAASRSSAYNLQRWFEPPTQQQAMDDHFWGRYTIPVGISVVKVDGNYVTMPTPTHDELEEAGTEGIDWFRGGYRYEISAEIETALIADGFL